MYIKYIYGIDKSKIHLRVTEQQKREEKDKKPSLFLCCLVSFSEFSIDLILIKLFLSLRVLGSKENVGARWEYAKNSQI